MNNNRNWELWVEISVVRLNPIVTEADGMLFKPKVQKDGLLKSCYALLNPKNRLLKVMEIWNALLNQIHKWCSQDLLKKDALELLKGWITELLIKFVRCLNSAKTLRDLAY